MTTSSPYAFIPGIPPEAAGWPGAEYSDSVDLGMRIERNVSVPMRDGLCLLVDRYVYDEGLFAQRHAATVNSGRHVLHTGGDRPSRLLVPIVPAKA